MWEFLFARVSGSVEYFQYTRVVISSSDIAGPVEVQVDLVNSSVEYAYIVNVGTNEVVTDPGISVIYTFGVVLDTTGTTVYPIPRLAITTTSPFSVGLSWEAVDGALSSASVTELPPLMSPRPRPR